MKKTLIAIVLLVAASTTLVTSCKKKSSDPDPVTPAVTTSTICDGNGSGTFYPLTLNNTWHYQGTGTNAFSNTVTGTQVYGSNTYFIVESNLGGTMYLRKATSGDIMAYNTGTSTEQMLVPASPTTGQSWTYTLDLAATRKVISTNASINTSSCHYTGCLKIQEFDSSGAGKAVMYYKKGVGMISTDEIWPGYLVTNLDAITLH